MEMKKYSKLILKHIGDLKAVTFGEGGSNADMTGGQVL